MASGWTANVHNVCTAVCTLFVTTDRAEREAADQWLRQLRKAGDTMLPIYRSILLKSPEACQVWQENSGLAAAVRTFAAQAVREYGLKARLPPGGDPSEFVADVLGLGAAEARSLLGMDGLVATATASRAVLTQLCLSAAAAGCRAHGWPADETLERMCSPLQSDAGGPAETMALLELLRLVPDELHEKRLSVAPARRQALMMAFEQAAEGISNALVGQLSATGVNIIPPVLAAWSGWLQGGLLPVSVVAVSPLMRVSLQGLTAVDPGIVAIAADVVCGAASMAVASAGPPRPEIELAQAATILVPSLLGVVIDLCDTIARSPSVDTVRTVVAIGVAAVAAAPPSIWVARQDDTEGSLNYETVQSEEFALISSCQTLLDCLSRQLMNGCQDLEAANTALEFWNALAGAAVRASNAELAQMILQVVVSSCSLPAELVAGNGNPTDQDDAEEARVGFMDVAKELVIDAPSIGPMLLRQLGSSLMSVLQDGVAGDFPEPTVEAILYAASMLARPAILGLMGNDEALQAVAVEACSLLDLIPAVLVAMADSAPLVRRTAVVLAGTLAPVLCAHSGARSDASLKIVLELVYSSLAIPHARMKAWGRGEDHVAAVALWRLGTACSAPLMPAFEQLAGRIAEAEVREAMLASGWAGRLTDGRCLLMRGMCGIVTAMMDHDANASAFPPADGGREVQRTDLTQAMALLGNPVLEELAGLAVNPVPGPEWSTGAIVAVQLATVLLSELPPSMLILDLAPLILESLKALVVAAAAVDGGMQRKSAMLTTAEVARVVTTALVKFITNLRRQPAGTEAAVAAVCNFVCTAFEAQPNRQEWFVAGQSVISAKFTETPSGPELEPMLVELLQRLVTTGHAQLEDQGGLDGAPDLASSLFSLVVTAGDVTPSILAVSGGVSTALALAAAGLNPAGAVVQDRSAGTALLVMVSRLARWSNHANNDVGEFAKLTQGGEEQAISEHLASGVWSELQAGLAANLVLGIIAAAAGTMPSWMIEPLADALHGIWACVGDEIAAELVSNAVAQVRQAGLLTGVKKPRNCDQNTHTASTSLCGLLEERCKRDRREFKKRLKMLCGGKKKGTAGAPPSRGKSIDNFGYR